MMNCGLKSVPSAANIALEEPVTMEELFQAIKLGKPNKAPGRAGICPEFIKKTWEVIKYNLLEIMNDMYRDGIISDQQNHGIRDCLPKNPDPMRIEDYRPLTLMNTDYKLFTRFIANRLRPWLIDILQPSQHCGLSGNTAFDAVATIRDAVAYAETTGTPVCVLAIDFKEAFDRISHSYLYTLLRQYGFNDRFQQKIRNICDNATASIQITGHRSCPIQIRSSVRQGCPISMQLFAMCLNPLLFTLENNLAGIQIGRRRVKTTVVAYADDVTIFAT